MSTLPSVEPANAEVAEQRPASAAGRGPMLAVCLPSMPSNDFAAMVPYLERTVDLSREYSSYFAPYKHIADPHIDDADEGMTTASTHKLFEEHRTLNVWWYYKGAPIDTRSMNILQQGGRTE